MSKDFYHKNKDIDYHKSLNKIVILGLTGMATLGTSMLIVESAKSEASPLKAVSNLIAKNVLRLPGIRPSAPTMQNNFKLNIPKLNVVRNVSTKNGLSKGAVLSLSKKFNINNGSLNTSKPPIIVQSGSSNLSTILKPR